MSGFRRWVVLMLAVTAVCLGGPAQATAARPGVLVNQFGQPVPQGQLRGHYILVYFGYTYCPDICPMTLSMLSDVLEQLGPLKAKLKVLFVTVDPARATPDVMRAYLAHFDPAIIGMTGSPAEILSAEAAFGAPVRPPAKDGTIAHGAFIYFMGPDGKAIQSFHAEDKAESLLKILRATLKH